MSLCVHIINIYQHTVDRPSSQPELLGVVEHILLAGGKDPQIIIGDVNASVSGGRHNYYQGNTNVHHDSKDTFITKPLCGKSRVGNFDTWAPRDTKSSPHDFVMLQGHRYLEPPILVVQRRRVKSQHPNSHPPHTSNSVQNCVSRPTTTLQ